MSRIELNIPYEFTEADKKAFNSRYEALLKFNSVMLNEFNTTYKGQNLFRCYSQLLMKVKEVSKKDIVIRYQLPFGLLQKELVHLMVKYIKGAKIYTKIDDTYIQYLTYPISNSCFLRVENDVVKAIEPYKSLFVINLPDTVTYTKEDLKDSYLNLSYKPSEGNYRVKLS
jgi:hypothetical protein